jgi:hypothetical protein
VEMSVPIIPAAFKSGRMLASHWKSRRSLGERKASIAKSRIRVRCVKHLASPRGFRPVCIASAAAKVRRLNFSANGFT